MNTPDALRPVRKIVTAAVVAVAAITCMSAAGTPSAAGAHHGKSAVVQATKEWKAQSHSNEVVLATKEWKRPVTTTLGE
jgi:3-oxoacyl-ACP reductase-like protein